MTAFLQLLIDKTIYVEQLYSFEEGEDLVYLLLRALYRLKQSLLL
jgi:hypothetical protein